MVKNLLQYCNLVSMQSYFLLLFNSIVSKFSLNPVESGWIFVLNQLKINTVDFKHNWIVIGSQLRFTTEKRLHVTT
ncbi:unnamed protein product [Tenebrio molitor]|nr:unnamed protein product [Tenebrio molitor]